MRALLATPTITYCEQAVGEFIQRPWSTLSNLAFIGAGIVILSRSNGSRLENIFGGTAILIGILSTIYDSSYTYLSQLLDLSGMIVFVSLLLYLNILSIGVRSKIIVVSLVSAWVISLLTIISLQGYSGDIIFGLYVGAVVMTEIYLMYTKHHHRAKLWFIAFVIFVMGFIFWLLDGKRVYCIDFGLLNGRAIFHYCGAVALYMLYRFYKVNQSLVKIRS